MQLYFIIFQQELDLDSSYKPKVKLSDLSESECPCPQEYLDVSVDLELPCLHYCLHGS